MYGKRTALRLAAESAWGEVPTVGWVEAALVGGKLSLSGETPAVRTPPGAAAGRTHGTAKCDVSPAASNLAALASAALSRDGDGEMASYTLEVCDADGARRISGAVVRRFKARAGVARVALEFHYDLVGKATEPCDAFPAAGAEGKPFTFGGSSCTVDLESVALAEFCFSVNNNVFAGPADDGGAVGFVSAGRQALTGYLVTGADRRDLVDSDEHAIEVRLGGDGAEAVITAGEVFFTWCREIRSASEGALQVLYFEGAGGSISGGLEIGLV